MKVESILIEQAKGDNGPHIKSDEKKIGATNEDDEA